MTSRQKIGDRVLAKALAVDEEADRSRPCRSWCRRRTSSISRSSGSAAEGVVAIPPVERVVAVAAEQMSLEEVPVSFDPVVLVSNTNLAAVKSASAVF